MPDPNMKPQLLKGFRDFLPGTMILRQRIMSRWPPSVEPIPGWSTRTGRAWCS